MGDSTSDVKIIITLATPQAGQSDALDEITLQKNDQNDSWYHRDGRTGHHITPLRAMLALEHLQAQRDGRHIGSIDHNERPQEVVPEADEGEEAQHPQGSA